jgi:hypothetical protein
MNRIGALIVHPPTGPSEVERQVSSARAASALDLAEAIFPRVDALLLVGSIPLNGSDLPLWDPVPCDSEEPFHLGNVLKKVIREQQLDGLLYFGSGSGAILLESQLDELVRFARASRPGALLNNFYSCDYAAVSNAQVLLSLSLPERDNGLGFCLADAGIPCFNLPRTVHTQFDLDTPIDLLLIKETDRGGPRLRSCLENQVFHHPMLERVCSTLTERSALVYLIGRVSPMTWQAFETQVACRTAGFIEGRGMKAYTVARPPILATVFRQRGARELFTWLEGAADAAIIDSRPLLAWDGTLPSARDRFSSDLFRHAQIEDPRWREFTHAAAESSVPALLGGHSLVSGGLYLLSEICWKGRNLPRRLHPEPYKGDGTLA